MERPQDHDPADLAARLTRERPLPQPEYRGRAGRELAGQRVALSARAQRRLMVACALPGLALGLLALLGLAGAGPLG